MSHFIGSPFNANSRANLVQNNFSSEQIDWIRSSLHNTNSSRNNRRFNVPHEETQRRYHNSTSRENPRSRNRPSREEILDESNMNVNSIHSSRTNNRRVSVVNLDSRSPPSREAHQSDFRGRSYFTNDLDEINASADRYPDTENGNDSIEFIGVFAGDTNNNENTSEMLTPKQLGYLSKEDFQSNAHFEWMEKLKDINYLINSIKSVHSCSICYNNFTAEDQVAIALGCSCLNNFICCDCLQKHLSVNKNKQCPFCRNQIHQYIDGSVLISLQSENDASRWPDVMEIEYQDS